MYVQKYKKTKETHTDNTDARKKHNYKNLSDKKKDSIR